MILFIFMKTLAKVNRIWVSQTKPFITNLRVYVLPIEILFRKSCLTVIYVVLVVRQTMKISHRIY